MAKIGGTKKTETVPETAPAWFVAYQEQQNKKIAELEAQLAAERNRPSGGKQYAPAKTTPEQALSLAKEHKDGLKGVLRQMAHLMVEVIPNSPATPSNPYGTPVLINMKNSNQKMVKIKSVFEAQTEGGRGDYIKLRKMVEQLAGDYFTYREPAELTTDQIKGILCPLLDRLNEAGLFSW